MKLSPAKKTRKHDAVLVNRPPPTNPKATSGRPVDTLWQGPLRGVTLTLLLQHKAAVVVLGCKTQQQRRAQDVTQENYNAYGK